MKKKKELFAVTYIDGHGDGCVFTCVASDENSAVRIYHEEVGYYYIVSVVLVK